MAETILVVDNEPDILRFVEINLRLHGYDVVAAHDGAEALEAAFRVRPDLVVLDVMMPGIDGFEVTRRLRADPRTGAIPIIILTGRSLLADKVLGLTAGADDYVLKPFDPLELVARVTVTLARAAELRSTSPLTGLPGNHRIDTELARRLAAGEDMAVVYADVNDFKSYNDRYGFLRGDSVIMLTADVLQAALSQRARPGWFLGHIGGDDFTVVCHPGDVEAVCKLVVAEFDRRIVACYDEADVRAGYVEMPDRQGTLRRFPLASVSLGVATTEHRVFVDHRELVAIATEMKAYVKGLHTGSGYAIDSRAPEPAAAPADAVPEAASPATPGAAGAARAPR